MEGDFIKINEWLTPLSWFYGLGVNIRNFLFDTGMQKSRSFKTPVISVGNITVGGTGKTPHVEYLVRLLQDHLRLAVLSRGYKRKTNGFVIADDTTKMSDIGDEPFQMKQKFPKLTVAVDHSRADGICRLTKNDSKDADIDVVLLDDAFQHRQVKPGINILLVDYHRLIIYDKLLPAGRLREPLKGKNRADIVIVTKCPKDLKPMEFRVITKAMDLFPYQRLFFSTLDYDAPQPVFMEHGKHKVLGDLKDTNVLLLTGIASPRQLSEDLTPHVGSITPLTFADHHYFSQKDVELINSTFDAMPSPKCIITTEKDAVRLTATDGLSDDVRRNLYQQPVRVSLLLDQEETFNQYIIDYVRKNARRHITLKPRKVSTKADDTKAEDTKADETNADSTKTKRPHTISFR
jgi:tetraacyldisaccharide 4'-kinase